MRLLIFAASIGLTAMTYAGAAAKPPAPAQNGATTADETERLNDAAAERARVQAGERARVEARIRQNEENNARIDRDNARRQAEYDEQMRVRNAAIAAEQARYDAEMARFREQQAAQRGGGPAANTNGRANAERRTTPPASAQIRTASTSTRTCAQQVRRARGRGRAVGGFLGGVAGVVGGRNLGNVARVGVAALSAPVGALIGDAIASRLDCREQEQAARATEQAVEGGVGTTVTWQSETRPGVSGTTTVTAEAPPAPVPATPVLESATRATAPAASDPAPVATASASVETSPCLTVTDVIIVDGEETRAPKRMCRRPPSNRYIRV